MKIKIKIYRDRSKGGLQYDGVIEFEENNISIPIKVADSDLLKIHDNQLLMDTHLANGQNVYQATFQIIDED